MLLDILTACDGHFSKIQPLLESIAGQTMLPDRVVILIYTKISKEEQELFVYYLQRFFDDEFFSRIVILSHLNCDHEPGKGHGYDRHYLLAHAKSKLTYMIDCDNIIKEDHVAQMLLRYDRIKQEQGKTPILSPTIMWRKSGKVQSQGIKGFRFFFPRYQYAKMGAQNRQQVKMIGANTLLGPTTVLQRIGFDAGLAHSYEDIDFTYRLYLAGYPVTVLNKVETYHMESTRGVLGKRLIGNPKQAWHRAHNRIIFVKKNGTIFQKIQYFGLGMRIQTFGFLALIVVYGGRKRVSLLKAIIGGTKDGLQKKIGSTLV